MRLTPLLLASLVAPLSAQLPCGSVPGVEVSVSPAVAPPGAPVTVTLTNLSAGSIDLSSSCVWKSVHVDDCGNPPIVVPICLSVITTIPPGGSKSMLWDQTDGSGAPVAPGTYTFQVEYFAGAFSPNSCCATVEVCAAAPAAAVETVRLGTPPNPAAFLPGATSGPVLGAVWDPSIDHSSFLPGAVLDAVAVSSGSLNVATPAGTLLCSVVPSPVLVTTVPGTPFAIPVPADCSLVGASLCSQGGSVAADGTVALANALDLILGTF